ncbi:histone-lysine N-methyltransferase EZA isoform X6 [Spatholobus suberectus]|nr:histone-lysine N-methyltransferase EZA isoform X6 [Spatholobus suberectus]
MVYFRVKSRQFGMILKLKSKVCQKIQLLGMIRIRELQIEADGILTPSTIEEPSNQSTSPFPTEVDCHGSLNLNVSISVTVGKRKVTNQSDTALYDSTIPPDDSQNSYKKLKTISNDVVTVNSDSSKNLNLGTCDESEHTITCAILDKSVKHNSNKIIDSSSSCHSDEQYKSIGDGPKDPTNKTEFKKLTNSMEAKVDGMLTLSDWKPLEKELYLKGVKLLGRNKYRAFYVSPHTIMLRNARIAPNLI